MSFHKDFLQAQNRAQETALDRDMGKLSAALGLLARRLPEALNTVLATAAAGKRDVEEESRALFIRIRCDETSVQAMNPEKFGTLPGYRSLRAFCARQDIDCGLRIDVSRDWDTGTQYTFITARVCPETDFSESRITAGSGSYWKNYEIGKDRPAAGPMATDHVIALPKPLQLKI